jgi:predicted amidophosphoribosyltransferase
VEGRRVLLIDDVFTTGATVNECAKTLLAAGATEVAVYTLARVE